MKVSIITVCFNSAKTIEQTIQSVINQTYLNIEYIIIDGGSTDGTVDIIKKYEKNIAYWVSEPDQGLYDAMNKGIARASGEVIGIVNSDDWYELSTVEKVVQCFETTDAEFVHGNRREIDEEYKLSYIRVPKLQMNMYYSHVSLHSTVFVKREIYKKYGDFNCRYRIAADIDLMLRFYDKGVKFCYLDEILTNFRVGGVSGSLRWKGLREAYQIFLYILRDSKKVDSEEYIDKVNYFFNRGRKNIVDEFVDRRLARTENDMYKKTILRKTLKGKEDFILFGTGNIGLYFYRWCLRQKINVIFSVDNSISRQKEKLGGIMKIESPKLLLFKNKGAMIVIGADKAKDDMEKQLLEMGFVYQRDYLFYTDIMKLLRQVYIREKLLFIKNFPRHDKRL